MSNIEVRWHTCPVCGIWHNRPYQLCEDCEKDTTRYDMEDYDYEQDDFNYHARREERRRNR